MNPAWQTVPEVFEIGMLAERRRPASRAEVDAIRKLLGRGRMPRLFVALRDAELPTIPSHENQVIARVDLDSIGRQCQARDRQILGLFLEGYRTGEIATRLGLTHGAIVQRRRRLADHRPGKQGSPGAV